MSALTLGPLHEKEPMSDTEQLGQKVNEIIPNDILLYSHSIFIR